MAEEQKSNLPILAGLRDVADSHTNATASLGNNISRGLRNVVGSITNLKESFLSSSTRQMNRLEDQILKQEQYFDDSIKQQKAAASGPLQIIQSLFGFMTSNQAGKIAKLEDARAKQEKSLVDLNEKIVHHLIPALAAMNQLARETAVQSSKSRQDEIIRRAEQEQPGFDARSFWSDAKDLYARAAQGDEKASQLLEGMRENQRGFMKAMESLQNAISFVKESVPKKTRRQIYEEMKLPFPDDDKETAAKLSSEAQNTAAVKQNTNAVKGNTEEGNKTGRSLREIFGKGGSFRKMLQKFVKDMSEGASGLGTWLLGFGKSMLRWMPMLAAFGSSAIDYFGAQGAKESRKQHWMSQGYSEEEANRLGQAGTEGYGSSFGTLAGAGIGMVFGGPIGSAIGAVAGNYIGKLLTGPDSIGEKLEKFVIDWGRENDKILQREENLVNKEEMLQMEDQPWWRDVLNSLGFGPAMNQIDENRRRALENAKRKRDADAIDQNERALRDSEILARKAREDKAFREALEATKNNPEQMRAVIEQYKKIKEQPSTLEMNKKTDGALLNEKGSLDSKVIVVPAPAQQSSAPVTNNITNNTTKISMGTDPNFKARVTPEYNSYGRPALA